MQGLPPDLSVAQLVALIPPGSRVLVTGCSTESVVFADAVEAAKASLGAAIFTGIFVPGLNTHTYGAGNGTTVETFFLTPELKSCGPSVTFLPLCYDDIRQHLLNSKIDAALMMVSPPDENGICSFGPAMDFLAELWPRIPLRLAHINPLMPRTYCGEGIPVGVLSAVSVVAQPLLGTADPGTDPVTDAIAKHVAEFVPNGATVQTGLGKVPSAVLRALRGRRDLRLHSGLIGDAVVDLEEAGALAPGVAVTAGVAIGSERLYKAVVRPIYRFAPVCVTHDPTGVGAMPNFRAINSANEVDLFGQAYAEVGPKGLMSGPGGATDFARGARLGGGLRIVALAASAAKGTISRIVPPNAGSGPVSLGRMDVDVVVTEFGAADLRDKTYDQRASALIDIAGPDHRDWLSGKWQECARAL